MLTDIVNLMSEKSKLIFQMERISEEALEQKRKEHNPKSSKEWRQATKQAKTDLKQKLRDGIKALTETEGIQLNIDQLNKLPNDAFVELYHPKFKIGLCKVTLKDGTIFPVKYIRQTKSQTVNYCIREAYLLLEAQ